MTRRLILPAAVFVALAAPPGAAAAVSIGPKSVVVEGSGGRAVITRSPYSLSVQDKSGRTVLREAPRDGAGVLPIPPTSQSQFGTIGPPPPTLYGPLGFLVGHQEIGQEPVSQWEGNLTSVTQTGVKYVASAVVDAAHEGSGARLTLSTTDPTGRRLVVRVKPGPAGTIVLSARPTPTTGVATMADSFRSPGEEAFRGFGGRHNALDQRGSEFYNWLQQENFSSGSTSEVTTPTVGSRYMFPNGPSAAYYVQSSFISSAGYGFLLDRDELTHWRMASDRPDAWQAEAAGPALDYVVAPGGPGRAIGSLTALNGRQRVPPAWAVGPIFDRLVKFPSDPPEQHEQEVAGDIRDLARYHVPLEGYRIEGWQFLPRTVLKRFISQLRARSLHPMLYFRAFVGQDDIGTDDPNAYDEAVAKGYVATTADGRPYTFVSNFNQPAAQIDFTKPDAVKWWQGRVRQALDLGADGFMQDFGEQVLTDMHFHDGSTGASMHNRLPVLYHRATRALVSAYEKSHRGRRIFFYTRAGYSGSPGSAAYEGGNFPGDETTDWTQSAGLASLARDMLNRAVGGAYGYTTDIGGFFDVGPYSPTDKELFLRWAQWAALSPLFRLHGSVGDGTHGPWTYDLPTVWAYNALSRLHLRARGLILRLWRSATRDGIPITRPLWLAAPGDRKAATQDQEWLLGPDIVVAPVVAQGAGSRRVYFPPGCWRNPESGAVYRGSRSYRVPAGMFDLPYFFRCHRRPFEPFATGAATLPRARSCRAGAKLTVSLLRFARGERLVSVDVYANHHRALSRTEQSLPAKVSLAGLPSGPVTVRVVTRTDRGRAAASERRYRACG
jgi:alpha-glucosidase (family GH31 glycosyl hydrolase)